MIGARFGKAPPIGWSGGICEISSGRMILLAGDGVCIGHGLMHEVFVLHFSMHAHPCKTISWPRAAFEFPKSRF